ncbi:MAG: ferritin [Acidobacteriota bacterium]
MISKTMEQAFNAQMHEELYSFYLYLSMSAYLDAEQYKGMAHWMRTQAEEERGHAMKFFDHLGDRGGRPILPAIKKPQASWASPKAAFEAALTHEKHITACINALMDQAIKEKDHASAEFLHWFIKEQVEEIATLEPIVEQFRRAPDSVGGHYFIDHRLGKRG